MSHNRKFHTGLRGATRRPDDRAERGQAIVFFALLLVVVIGAAGLLIDGGMAYANRRAAQSAADLAALAAADAVADAGFPCNATGQSIATTAANRVAGFNGFSNVSIQYPATTGTHTGCSYLRVTVSRQMNTTFSRILGQNSLTPAATAVATMTRFQGAAAANCTFCSLNSSDDNHTLLVQLGSTLIVDGEIYVNSSNGNRSTDPNSPIKLTDWHVGGDGFDIFGTGGRIEATKISVVGGWETHDNGIAVASQASCPASQRPDPIAYGRMSPPLTGNVCIHQPVLTDPLAGFPTPSSTDYVTRATKKSSYAGSVSYALEPGTYIGGIEIAGNANVTLNPGVYFMAGGGFSVKGNGSVNGSGVTIYSGNSETESSKKKKKSDTGAIEIDTKGTVVLTPPTSGTTAGMTLFMDRYSDEAITIYPNSTTQCATTAAAGRPQGCIGGISGTIYAAHQDSTVIIKAAGTANLQVLSGRMLITNGSTARFTYDSTGFASTMTIVQLVE
jgi:Flp pilus assembly protein TadG